MNLNEAKNEALQLSVKQWNRYFHIVSSDNKTYSIDRYFNDNAKFYFLKGIEYKHSN